MLKNYLITAWRDILRAKGFSLLNIAGLAVGLAVCLLIMLYVRAELSYDPYHQHFDRIYRVQNASLKPDGSIGGEFATLAPSFALLLRNNLPEIEGLARTWNPSGTVVKAGDRLFTEERFFFAEPEVFDIMTLPFIQGDPATALKDVGGMSSRGPRPGGEVVRPIAHDDRPMSHLGRDADEHRRGILARHAPAQEHNIRTPHHQ